jgi:single-strand DNA-binding protein
MAYILPTAIIGKICKDVELKTTKNGKSICEFNLANSYGFGENKRCDFVRCVAFGKTAEIVSKYFHKGSHIIVKGEFHNNPYKKDEHGYDIPNWQFNVSGIEFLPKEQAQATVVDDYAPVTRPAANAAPKYSSASQDDFSIIMDDNSDLPF